MTRQRAMGQVAVLAAALALSPAATLAQGAETHPAKLDFGRQKAKIPASAHPELDNSPKRIGPDLRALVILNVRSKAGHRILPRRGVKGVDTAQAGPLAQDGLDAALTPYLGKPLSFRLIGEIQTAITDFYRRKGRPLVSVNVPPQEITDGGLQLDVTLFILGETRVQGKTRVPPAYLTRQIRIRPGQQIDSDTLVDDLNWLSLNPFRGVQGVFEPGRAFGTTDITLEVTTRRPWSGYVGAANSGASGTYRSRVFAGFNTAALPFPDHQLAYQFTAAPQSLGHGDLWDVGRTRGYVSHALSYFAPLTFGQGTRAKFTLQAYHVSSYSVPGGVLTTAKTTSDVNAELAFPLTTRHGAMAVQPEPFIRLEHKTEQTADYFSGLPLPSTTTDVTQLALGIRANLVGPLFGLASEGDVSLYGVVGHHRVRGGTGGGHAYAVLDAHELLHLDGGSALALRLKAQLGSSDLPSTEYFGVGGAKSVRGYDTNELSGPGGVSAGIEWRAKKIAFGKPALGLRVTPHVFLDAGHVSKSGTQPAASIASAGFGARLALGEKTTGNLDVAYCLRDAVTTRRGDLRMALNLVSRF